MRITRNTVLDKHLPKGLGILVLLFSLGTIFWLSRNAILIGSKAAVSGTPKDVKISNVSDTSFTVSYVTDDAVNGSLSYGNSPKLGSVAFDIRDKSTPLDHTVHYINVSNLSPFTKYFFSIVSADKNFLNGTNPYEVTTTPTSSDSAKPNQINGMVEFGDSSADEAVAYLQSDNSQVLSALVNPNGNYQFRPSIIRSSDLSSVLTLSQNTVLHLKIIDSTSQSVANLLLSQTNPIPPIVLSKDYDFTINGNASTETSTESAQTSSFPDVATSDNASPAPQIISPQTNQQFKDAHPTFQGKALPGNDVEITIQSTQEITTTVQADSTGNWQYRPTTPLSPGQHTLTIKTPDASGIIKTITQQFTVFAEGSQFVEPSISPTEIPSPTIEEPTPTAVPTAIPTLAPSPTATPTAAPTPIIIITTPIVSSPSATPVPIITTPPIPKSGNSDLLVGIIGISSIIGIGGLIFFLL